MLDLSKNLGVFENLIFYGDHDNNSLVYYLPDEVNFSKTNIGGEEDYELMLQLFQDGQSIVGNIDQFKKNSGGILSLGIECKVTSKRLSKALEQLIDERGLPEDTSASLPLWETGKVDLIVLDSTTQDLDTINQESFVKKVIGSKKPSLLTSDLKSIFNVRLDNRGAAIIASSLSGERGHMAGVLYDLKFRALQPALDLRIWADLERCYKTVSHKLGIKAEFTYYVKFSLGADFEHITREMEENGDLKIEVLSQVTDPKMKKLVDETIKDTKEKVLRELFKPMVNPGIDGSLPVSLGLEEAIPKVGVAYEFKHIKGVQSRVIDLDFRERSATLRTHNPQAHLWMLGQQINHKIDRYSKMINFSDLWRMHELKLSLVHDFSNELDNLLAAEILVWRHSDGLAITQEQMSGLYHKPKDAKTLASFTFSATEIDSKTVSWTTEKNEVEGFYYQVRFVFDPLNENIDSPEQIITEPVLSYSRDLPIILNAMTLNRKVKVLKGNIDFEAIHNVNITLNFQSPDNEIVDRKLFVLNKDDDELTWWFRRKDKEDIFLTEQKEFHYKANIPSVSSTKRYLTSDEIVVNSPFKKAGRTIIPILAGSSENIQMIILSFRYQPEGIDEKIKKTFTARAPEISFENIVIEGINNDVDILFSATAITNEGKQITIDEGIVNEEALIIDLKKISIQKTTIKWLGGTPDSQDLKYLKLEFAKELENEKEVFDERKYTGDRIPVDETIVFKKNTFYRIIKRFSGGETQKTDWLKVQNRELIIN